MAGLIGLSMKTLRVFAIFCVCFVGCNQRIAQQNSTPPKTRDTSNQSFDELITAWGDMGMMFPDSAQVDVFRADFETSRSSLRDALSHSDNSVRMRAAYVIGEIGDIAKPAGEELLARLLDEPDELVRIYIVDALNSVGYDTNATIAALSDRFETLDGNNVPPNNDHSYAEVDEKIKVASALFSLSDTDSRSKYYDFVTQWLDPPADDLKGTLLDGYWERRWIAVNSIEQMPEATDAIPKLESLLAEPNAKLWVNTHVPRVLGVLRKNVQ
tara:strand:+ start:642 stop:1451 length:810 start_codon:yes stop_codon:yes gene_type:complete